MASVLAISLISAIPVFPQKTDGRKVAEGPISNAVPAQKLIDVSRSDDQRVPEADRITDAIHASKLLASDGATQDDFGQAVAMTHSTAVIGAPSDTVGSNVEQGSAYVFVRVGVSWVQQAKLTASDGAAGDRFGTSVAISGDKIVIGAPDADIGGHTDQGAAYVFSRSGSIWTQESKLVAGDGSFRDAYGYRVAVDGDTVAVSAPEGDVGGYGDQGTLYVYFKQVGSWVLQAHLIATDGDEHDALGMSLALSGNTLIAGAPYDDLAVLDQGSVYVFTREGVAWSQQGQLISPDFAAYDYFGWSVAMSGDTLAVGAQGDDIGGNSDQGSAYVFVRSGGIFTQQAKVAAFDGASDDRFGYSVALDGDSLVIGAPMDDNGANYDQGSVYITERAGTLWMAQLKLLVSDGAAADGFGYSVGGSGLSFIAGSPFDANGSSLSQGSAFLIEFLPSVVADFDGDGLSDMSVFRPNGASGQAEWWYLSSAVSGAYGALGFGSSTDVPVPADYTGDGKTDVAFFRPSTGYWFVVRSEDSSFYAFPFGTLGDSPAPGDYDGDGKTDAAVFRGTSGLWYGLRSSDRAVIVSSFGQTGDSPIVGDYDGDGRDDIALFRKYGALGQAEWWVNRSTLGVIGYAFGESTDIPYPGDYTGDGKTDIAFFRSSTADWYILRSSDNSYYAFPFGISTDIPAPGDYDGDGRTDPAVYRQGQWYIFNSGTGTSTAAPFGFADDSPIPGILY